MTQRRLAVLYLSVVLLPLGICGCARRKAQARFPVEQYQALIGEGDKFFEKGHLWGWRQAALRYEKAWEMARSDELLERRVVCLTLQATRERDELIPPTATKRELDQLQPFTSPKLQLLQALAASYRHPRPALPAGLSASSFAALDPDHSPAEAYLYLLCLKTFQPEKYQQAEVALAEKYKDSNLFRYSAPAEEEETDQLLQREPEFAELRFFSGHSSFQKMELAKARGQFEKTIELLPDDVEAMNSLGDVYLFGFRDNAKALEHYERTFKVDPNNIKGLFGKGVVLHYLGQYTESTRFLDSLLSQKQGWDLLPETQTRYYYGQAYYYKAYNAYLSGNFPEARKGVDAARSYVPNFGGVYYLSGLLYYRLREMESAKRDFLRALEEGREYCDAPYYLGIIDRARDGEGSAAYFLACADCYRKSLEEGRKQIQGVPKLDITEAEKQGLKSKLEKDIVELGRTAGNILDDMLRILPELQFEGKALETQLLTEVSQQLQAVAESGR